MAEISVEVQIEEERITSKIYFVRGQKIMLDEDLAFIYGVKTKVLNQAVKRNPDRFPPDFMFQLTEDELYSLRSQNVISKNKGGRRYLPYAFTEQGVAMLSSVLKSKTAISVNIQIMRVFTKIRQVIADTTSLQMDVEKIKAKLASQDADIKIIFTCLDELIEKHENTEPRIAIGFNR